MDYLFTRSKYFRELFVKDLQPFFERAIGTDSEKYVLAGLGVRLTRLQASPSTRTLGGSNKR